MHARRFLDLFVVSLIFVAGVTSARAQDKPTASIDRKDVDRQLYRSLRDVIDQGADLYNEGNHTGAYYLFHGALAAAGPLLSHHPDVQKYIQTGMASAARLPRFGQRAVALRGVLDRVRTSINPNRKPAAATLWDRLGGEDKVRKVVDDFVAAAAADPKVDFTRGGKFKELNLDRLKKMLVEQISDVAGGPYRYTGRSMREVHREMGITEAQFDALAGHLKQSLTQNGAKPDDVTAVLKVLGGTRPDIVEKEPAPKKAEEKKPESKELDAEKLKNAPKEDKPAPANDSSLNQPGPR